MTETAPGPASLVDELHAGRNLPAELRPAFLAVRREDYIPDRVWIGDDDGPYRPIDRVVEPDRWADAVYADRPIVTQFDDGATEWPAVGRRPTCSASMPSAVAGMLAELDPQPGERVFEVGTGTGYNAALLAHQVGPDGHVTSVDVDPMLSGSAAVNLAVAGVGNVEVRAADATAADGVPSGLDRVIATAAVRLGQMPYPWVANTRPGGVIVAPMRTDMSSGPLVRFVVDEDATASGWATSRLQVGFMQLRAHRILGGTKGVQWDYPTAEVSHTLTEPWSMLGELDSRWPVAVALPSTVYDLWEKTEQRRGVALLHDPLSGSWASVTPAENTPYFFVRQFGPRRLWDAAEAAWRWWRALGKPKVEEWEWRVGPDGQSVTAD